MSGTGIPPDLHRPGLTLGQLQEEKQLLQLNADDHGWTVHFQEIEAGDGTWTLNAIYDRPETTNESTSGGASTATKAATTPTAGSSGSTTTLTATTADELFTQKAPGLMRDLIRDFSLTREQAAGILGNIGHECAGFRHLREIGQPEGKGGYGWAQWTASRRVSFLAWAAARNLDWHDDAANYGYLCEELRTTHKSSITKLKATTTLDGAVEVFMNEFERPGVPHLEPRKRYARLAMQVSAAG